MKTVLIENTIYLVWPTSADMPKRVYNWALDTGRLACVGNYENGIRLGD